jgi:hypothetical protein
MVKSSFGTLAVALSVGALLFFNGGVANAACTLPYTITNGHPADASQVMADYNAIVSCLNATVAPATAGQIGYYPSGGTSISGTDLSSLIDASAGSAQGSILYRDAAGWKSLPPGTSSQFLQTLGSGANPQWANPASGGGSTLLASLTADQGNGNDTSEDTLYTYTTPGNTLNSNGDTLEINVAYSFAANNHLKSIRLYFGSALIGIAWNVPVSSAATVGTFKAQIVRRAQTSQLAFGSGQLYAGTAPASSLNTGNSFAWFTPATSDLSGPVVITVTGQTGTAAANDVVLKIFNVRKM